MKSGNYRIKLFFILAGFFYFGKTNSQNVITTTVPFLLITPDARSGGLADAGVATTPDANAMYWNPAKLAFETDRFGVSLSYTPWLRGLFPDHNLYDLSGYYKINNKSGIGASVRYNSMGETNFIDNSGNFIKTYKPSEFAFDAGYARKLSEHFSIAVSGRFIYSDLSGFLTLSNGETMHPASSFAEDFSGYYSNKAIINGFPVDFTAGLNVSNIGSKITYTDASHRDFLPANLKLGGCMTVHPDELNSIALTLDLNKLLVPTPNGKSNLNPPVISSIFSSFFDAPGGISEEISEINPSVALEYWYHKMLAGRIGFFYEDPRKGGRKYVTGGIGGQIKGFTGDLSYLFPIVRNSAIDRSPLENTFRFSIGYYLSNHSD